MKNKNFHKNIILGVIIAIVALVLLITRIKSNLKGSLPTSDDDTKAYEQIENPKGADADVDISLIEVNEEFFKSMNEKELLNYKIINAVDFFDTVEGELVQFGAYYNNTVKYNIDVKNSKSFTHDKSNEEDIYIFFNNGVYKELDNKEKTYRNLVVPEKNKEEMDNLRKLKPKQRYGGNGLVKFRKTEILTSVGNSILAEEYLANYLADYDEWSIEGNEEFIGRQCTKIAGKRDCVDRQTKAEKYTALIDTETGVVLKYDEMDASDKVVGGFETKYIKYNVKFDPKIFEIPSEGYTEKVYN